MQREDIRVAIVTGGSWGAGRELASALAARGCAVIVVYLCDQDAAEAVVADVHAAGGTALAVRADLTDELDVERVFDETAAVLGGVDLVVHAATRGTAVVLAQAMRRLRERGAILSVSRCGGVAGSLARQRGITVNGFEPGLEPPGPDRDVAELVELLDRSSQPRR